ncbi:hypothetical protein Tchar_01216 [Tepidimonas charontis]|uniref:Uncharacterized protein n=1 Tax=Tepidimonas charontis TaxID=2267262 RepID=A0A554XFW0_9BURK|nr:hypothetical protein Tchar_01216 [Tepidimonas charontis]
MVALYKKVIGSILLGLWLFYKLMRIALRVSWQRVSAMCR